MATQKLHFRWGYLTALLLIALLTSASGWLLISVLEQQERDADKINTSGLQRMLSQKIALYAHRLKASDKHKNIHQILEDALQDFERNHLHLTSAKMNLSPQLKALYFQGEPKLDSLVREYIVNAKKLLQTKGESIDLSVFSIENTENLVHKLNQIVDQFQEEAKNRVLILKKLEFALWIALILLLVLEARYIFYPMEVAIHNAIGLLQQKIKDIQSLDSEKQHLQKIANQDPLTGLYSLNAAQDFFQKLITLAEQNQHKLAVLFLDLDNFKLINDQYGHDVGDTVLVETAQRIQQELRNQDIACRIGGDEFLIVIDQMNDTQQLNQLCKRLLELIAKPIEFKKGNTIQIFASIGCSLFPEHACDTKGLKKLADTAMYEAKRNGKNSYFIFGSKVKFI